MAKEKNKIELPVVQEGDLQAQLIKLREDAGYSLPQMADALCLSEEVINHLENEEFELLAEPPYVRGYLRNYAKLGEIDSGELINCYEALRGADASELEYQIKSSSHVAKNSRKGLSPVLAQLILLALLLGGIALLSMIPEVNQWFQKTWTSITSQFQTTSTDTGNNPLLTGTMPVPIPLPETEEPVTSNPTELAVVPSNESPSSAEIDEKSSEKEAQTETSTTESTTNTQPTVNNNKTAVEDTETENKTEAETQIPPNENTVAASPDDPINIKLIFNKEVWMRIKDKDSKTVYESINKAGTDKSLQFKKPLTFRVGNAQGLSLFIDDKAVDISQYINGSVANFTLE